MNKHANFEDHFRKAVEFIDKGDDSQLALLLDEHPQLVCERLHSPGSWLRDQLGSALDSFFKDPYLLWFVSEDAVRNKTLPANIAFIAELIIRKAKAINAASLQEQLDYAMRLVAWSWVARECDVQLPLMLVLADAGAAIEGVSNDALVNGNFAAAEWLIRRGAKNSLPTALLLQQWDQADELARTANEEQKQFSLTLAALNGRASAISRLMQYGGIDINKPSEHLYSHATPLHHAVCSGSMESVRLLTDAGAKMDTRDTVYGGTAFDWAEHLGKKEIAEYLSNKHFSPPTM